MDTSREAAVLLHRARGGDAAALGELYDLHACGLFDLAYTICGSGTVAESAVLDAFQAACADSSSTDPAKHVSQELSRLVFLACRAAEEVMPAESRGGDPRHALLGLTLYGEHTYAEAARLLGLEPRVAAGLLRMILGAAAGTFGRHAR